MKAIAENLYLHENGHYYALWTANGKTERKSLGTKKLNEAKRALKRLMVPTPAPAAVPPQVPDWPNFRDGNLAQAALQKMLAGAIATLLRQAPPLQGDPGGSRSAVMAAFAPSLAPEAIGPSAAPSSVINGESPGRDRPPFTQAVAEHHANTAFTCHDTERNFILQQKKVLMHCGGDWAKFEPVPIWKEIQAQKFKSAPNQMRWYLRSLVDYGREKKWFNDSMLMEVQRIPLLKVNPRRFKMPPPRLVYKRVESWSVFLSVAFLFELLDEIFNFIREEEPGAPDPHRLGKTGDGLQPASDRLC